MSTTKVKLTQPRVCNRLNRDGKFAGHFSQDKDAVVDVPVDEARRMIEKGQAVEVRQKAA